MPEDYVSSKQYQTVMNIVAAQEKSLKALTARIDKTGGVSFEEWEQTKGKLVTSEVMAQKERTDALVKIMEKMRTNIGIAPELAKLDTTVKIAMARLEALGKQVEAMQKDQASGADLRALEKRLTEMIKKAK